MKNLKIRLPMYFTGLFIMTIGIALSVRSDLGVSPVSAPPYTLTVVWNLEMGLATFLFHIVLVLIQILLLRQKFKLKNLLQLVAGVVFGLFTTLCNNLVMMLPLPDNLPFRAVMLVVSIPIVAIGIFLYVPADIMPLAGEGTMLAVTEVTGFKFSNVKIGFDIVMSVISLTVCLVTVHNMGSVGIGTVVSAVFTGIVLGWITKKFGEKRERLLNGKKKYRKNR